MSYLCITSKNTQNCLKNLKVKKMSLSNIMVHGKNVRLNAFHCLEKLRCMVILHLIIRTLTTCFKVTLPKTHQHLQVKEFLRHEKISMLAQT